MAKVSNGFLWSYTTCGQYLLVVTDTYSKFPEVEIVKSTSAKACIPKYPKRLKLTMDHLLMGMSLKDIWLP
jgi:hypothetical protein